MNENKKPVAYFTRIVHNSLVNEYRQNANSSKHIVPVGDELAEIIKEAGDNENSIETLIGSQTPQDWLMFIENPRLHEALLHLSPEQLRVLFLLNVKGYNQKELSQLMGITHQALSKRVKEIYKVIKQYF